MVDQTSNNFPVTFREGIEEYKTTLEPFNINMYLDYGPMSVLNDDRTLSETARETYRAWYFRPHIDGSTISMYDGEVIVMYISVQNPTDENDYETWSCDSEYHMKNTVYVGHIHNYRHGDMSLSNDAVERDSATVVDQTYGHPEYTR